MSSLINSFWFAAAAAFTAWLSSCDGSSNDVEDAGNIHSGGTFTIPSAWNGRKVRAIGTLYSGVGASSMGMLKNSSAFNGAGSVVFEATSQVEGAFVASAPVVVSTGDTLTISGTSGSNSIKSVELLPSGVKGCLLTKSGTQSIATGGSFTTMTWDQEEYDTDSFHDNVTNNSRITIPSGTSGLFRFQANITINTSVELGIRLLKNGAALAQDLIYDTVGTSISLFSYPITVTAGDYFEIECRVLTTANSTAVGTTWFACEELDAGLQYAIAELSSNQSIASGSTLVQPASVGTEVIDTGGWHTGSNAHFTVPSGVSHVRTGFQSQKSSTTGAWATAVLKNDAQYTGMAADSNSSNSADICHGVSGVVSATAGDTFDLYASTDAGAQSMIAGSFFWIEEVPDVTV